MDGIVFEEFNIVAVQSRNIKIRKEAKDRKEIVLMWLRPCREHLHLAQGVWVGCPPPPAAWTGAGRDREGQWKLNTLVIFRPVETMDWRCHREPQSPSGTGRANRMIVSEPGSDKFCLTLSSWTREWACRKYLIRKHLWSSLLEVAKRF